MKLQLSLPGVVPHIADSSDPMAIAPRGEVLADEWILRAWLREDGLE